MIKHMPPMGMFNPTTSDFGEWKYHSFSGGEIISADTDGNGVWVVITTRNSYRSTDDALTWTNLGTTGPALSQHNRTVSYGGNGVWVINGAYYVYGDNVPTTVIGRKSTDNGATWSHLVNPSGAYNDVIWTNRTYAMTPTRLFSQIVGTGVTYYERHATYTSSNTGTSWTPRGKIHSDMDLSYRSYNFTYFRGSAITVTTDKSSENYGDSWNSSRFSNLSFSTPVEGSSLWELQHHFNPNTGVFVVKSPRTTVVNGVNGNEVAISKDNGATWEYHFVGGSVFIDMFGSHKGNVDSLRFVVTTKHSGTPKYTETIEYIVEDINHFELKTNNRVYTNAMLNYFGKNWSSARNVNKQTGDTVIAIPDFYYLEIPAAGYWRWTP